MLVGGDCRHFSLVGRQTDNIFTIILKCSPTSLDLPRDGQYFCWWAGGWPVRDGTLNHSSLLMFCAHTLTHATSAHFLRTISQLCFPRDLQKEIILFVDDFNILCAAFFYFIFAFFKKNCTITSYT